MVIAILRPTTLAPDALAVLASRHLTRSVELSDEELRSADVIWIGLEHYVDERVLELAPSVKFIATPTTGETHIDKRACEARHVQIVSLRQHTHELSDVRATSEFTLGLLLCLLRNIPAAAAASLIGECERAEFIGCEIFGKTVGIIGYGRLGRLMAGYLLALGAVVIACDPNGTDDRVRSVTLEQLLAESDIVCLHAAYQESNRCMLGRQQFAQMKWGAYFINTARGELVDEEALLDALESGRVKGAALDVRADEHKVSRESDSLIRYARAHNNLLLTPHIGGLTFESRRKTDLLLATLLLEKLENTGEPGNPGGD